jgi:fructose-bisphosphate aldolase class 1
MATVAQTPTAAAAVAEKPVQQKKAKTAISPGISLLSGGIAGAVEATATVSSISVSHDKRN